MRENGSSVKWERPVKTLDEALERVAAGCTTLQFEHRLDPYSDGEVNFARDAGDKIANLHLGDEGVVKLCNEIKRVNSPKLVALDLSGNRMGSEGIGAVADLLRTNTSIQILLLEDNRLDDEDAKYLADGLRSNTTLKELSLSGNRLGSKGAAALASCLHTNHTLQALWLNRNSIRDDGAKALGRSIKSKKSALSTLCLEENLIRERGARTLAKALQKNKQIRTLDLGGNKIAASGAQVFNKILKKMEKDHKKHPERGDDRRLELVLDGNRMNQEDLDFLKSKAETNHIELRGRTVYEDHGKDKAKRRVRNFLKYHVFDPRYASQGHFDHEKEIKRVL